MIRRPLSTASALAAIFCFSCLTAARPAGAADSLGNYVFKGAGNAPCDDFVEAFEGRAEGYHRFAGWIEGFLSAANRYEENTFDVAPWQSVDLMMSLVANNCSRQPEESVHTIVTSMMQAFFPQRLADRSEIIAVSNDRGSVTIYADVLARARDRLVESEYLTETDVAEEPAQELGKRTEDALNAYQSDRKLQTTGLPDTPTLAHLFTDLGEAPVEANPPED